MMITTYMKNIYRYWRRGGFRQDGVIYVRVEQVSSHELLQNKNILITGGGTGIGYAIAKRCVALGANVLITGRREETLKSACDTLGDHCKFLVHDIAELDRDGYKKIEECFDGEIDGIVNNAGISPEAHFGNCDVAVYNKIMDTNLRGHFFLSEYFVNSWLKQKVSGNIVMIASNSGVVGLTEPYAISKKGIISLTEGIAKKYGNSGIRCNAVAPDVTISEITEWSSQFQPEGNLSCPGVKRGRVFRAEEIAEVAVFLLSDMAQCVNGQTICCDNAGSLPQNTIG